MISVVQGRKLNRVKKGDSHPEDAASPTQALSGFP